MSTSVILEVTPREPRVDTDRLDPPLPIDLAAALRAAGVPLCHGWSCQGRRRWRMQWQLSGTDRVEVGRQLEVELRRLGYEADVSFWRG